MAQMSVSGRSAADVNCLQVLQHIAEDLFLITLPEATHTCTTLTQHIHTQDSVSRKAITASVAACTLTAANATHYAEQQQPEASRCGAVAQTGRCCDRGSYSTLLAHVIFYFHGNTPDTHHIFAMAP